MLRLYWQMIRISIRSQMQHKASFLMLMLSHFISTFVDIIGMWVLYERFKTLNGWILEELALIYGIIHMGFATAEAAGRGFDTFSQMIKKGDFDLILLRPVSTLMQIACRDFQLMRMGRFAQGFCVLLWSCYALGFSLFSWETPLIFLAFLGTTLLFFGLFVIQGSLCFWTVETLELMNITTYGGVEAGQYVITVYKPLLRYVFTAIIPLACVSYYPIATLLRHEDYPLWAGALFPLAGLLFLLLSFQTWKLGVRRYHSTGN